MPLKPVVDVGLIPNTGVVPVPVPVPGPGVVPVDGVVPGAPVDGVVPALPGLEGKTHPDDVGGGFALVVAAPAKSQLP